MIAKSENRKHPDGHSDPWVTLGWPLGACRIYPRGVGIAMAQLCGSRQAGLSFVVFWSVLSW